jgi:hypothetical protein
VADRDKGRFAHSQVNKSSQPLGAAQKRLEGHRVAEEHWGQTAPAKPSGKDQHRKRRASHAVNQNCAHPTSSCETNLEALPAQDFGL